MGQPDREELPVDAELREQPQDRDERRLQRHDEQADDDHEQDVAAREVHPANAYAANAATKIGMIVAGIVMNRLLMNAVADAVCVQHVGVVLEREVRRRERRPPAGRRDIAAADGTS